MLMNFFTLFHVCSQIILRNVTSICLKKQPVGCEDIYLVQVVGIPPKPMGCQLESPLSQNLSFCP